MHDADTAYNCTAVGHQAMENCVDGYNNIAIGLMSARNAFQSGTGHDNIILGSNAGKSLTSSNYNIVMGGGALEDETTGDYNIAIGHETLMNSVGGENNIAIGYYVAPMLSDGDNNTFVGPSCASTGTITGAGNCGYGQNALNNLTGGNYNTCIGKEAGNTLTTGAHAICVGYRAGKNQMTTTGDQLFIANGSFSAGNGPCFIYGDDTGSLIQGDNSSTWSTTSDQRLKKNIVDNTVGLTLINQVKVRNFEYRAESEIDRDQFPKVSQDKWTNDDESAGEGKEGDYKEQLALSTHPGVQLGAVAQELETVAPRCVKSDLRGVKTVNTDELFWHMINSIKELSAENTALKARLDAAGI